MGLTHGVRTIVLGSTLTAAAVVVMQGVAFAEETSTPGPAPHPNDSPAPAEAPATPKEVAATRPSAQGRAEDGPPKTTADEAEQPPTPATVRAASTEDEDGTVRAAAAITTPGPLTRVETTPDLNCAVSHAADSGGPAFFDDTGCATFVAVNGTLFGPTRVPSVSFSPRDKTPFTPIRQSPATGSGSMDDPHKVVTEVGLGTTGVSVVQTDSYVTGQEAYRTDVTLTNAGSVDRTAHLYRAGDCLLVGEDEGFGRVDVPTGSVGCLEAVSQGLTFVPGIRTQIWYPLSPGSHFYEDQFAQVWDRVNAHLPFPDLCALCATHADNGAGLSWEVVVPAGGSLSRSHLTIFSLAGALPLRIETTPRTTAAVAGSVVTYRVVVLNTNDLVIGLRSIVDTLPAGFSYVPGSTTGITNLDPTVVGQVLTWTVPTQLSSGGVALEFDVRVPLTPGTYLNVARADANPVVVLPSGGVVLTVVAAPEVVPTPPAGSGADVALPSQVLPLATRSLARAQATSAVAGGRLPATGADPQGLLVAACVMLAGGGALVAAGRRQSAVA